jgi:putative hydrolase of HD superfamily
MMQSKKQREGIVDFFFELGQMKRVQHVGWALAGIRSPDSIAEHALRAAQIAYLLAVLESADPSRAAMIAMIHDNAEVRIGDHHKVSARYLNTAKAEQQAFTEQVQYLPGKVKKDFLSFFAQYEHRTTKEGIVACDADWLEMAFEARELEEQGYHKAHNWIENIEMAVETVSAKKILRQMKKKSFCDWWKNLKKMTYRKL